MKLILILSMLTLSALACPDLKGTYSVCVSTTGQMSGASDVIVDQKVVNKFHVFTITTTDEEDYETSTTQFVADGKLRTEVFEDEDSGLSVKTATIASCKGSILTLKVVTHINQQEVGNISMNVTKAGKKMSQVISGNSMGQRISDTLICE